MQTGWRGHILGGFLWWCRVPQHVSLSVPLLLLWGRGCSSGMLLLGPRHQVGRPGSLWQLWCVKPPRLIGKGDRLLCWSKMLGCPRAGTQHPHAGVFAGPLPQAVNKPPCEFLKIAGTSCRHLAWGDLRSDIALTDGVNCWPEN